MILPQQGTKGQQNLPLAEVLHRYANLGLACIPIWGPEFVELGPGFTEVCCSCDRGTRGTPCESIPGKHPAVPWKGIRRPLPYHDLERLFLVEHRSRVDPNLGVILGACDPELVALDVDPRNGGDETLRALLAEHGPLPRTPQTLSSGGGGQQFFRRPPGLYRLSHVLLGPGLDFLQDRHYSVIPPSTHKTGIQYRWVTAPWDCPLADLPSWLADLATAKYREKHPEQKNVPGDPGQVSADTAAATTRPPAAYPVPVVLPASADRAALVAQARADLGRYRPAVQGQGGSRITFAAACGLVEWGLTPEEAWPLLVEYGNRCIPPWPPDQLRHKLDDAYRHATPGKRLAEVAALLLLQEGMDLPSEVSADDESESGKSPARAENIGAWAVGPPSVRFSPLIEEEIRGGKRTVDDCPVFFPVNRPCPGANLYLFHSQWDERVKACIDLPDKYWACPPCADRRKQQFIERLWERIKEQSTVWVWQGPAESWRAAQVRSQRAGAKNLRVLHGWELEQCTALLTADIRDAVGMTPAEGLRRLALAMREIPCRNPKDTGHNPVTASRGWLPPPEKKHRWVMAERIHASPYDLEERLEGERVRGEVTDIVVWGPNWKHGYSYGVSWSMSYNAEARRKALDRILGYILVLPGQDGGKEEFTLEDLVRGMTGGPQGNQEAAGDPGRACPSCGGPVTAQGICWPCEDRLCVVCGRSTGSPLISLCRLCELEHRTEAV